MWSVQVVIVAESVYRNAPEPKVRDAEDKAPGNCHFVSIYEQSLLLMT
jgi:hypothetical protein